MYAFHSPSAALHEPRTYFRRGKLIAALETPERYQVLREAVLNSGHALEATTDHGREPIEILFLALAADRGPRYWPSRCVLEYLASLGPRACGPIQCSPRDCFQSGGAWV